MNDEFILNTQSTEIFSTAFLLPNVGVPFIMGLAVGYFAKKMLKLALFLGGASIVLMFVSEYYGFFTLTDATLQHATSAAIETAQSSGEFLRNRLSSISGKGLSSVAGFYFGLKMG
jgi:uncharacterized membrane protein (Fun14 family)